MHVHVLLTGSSQGYMGLALYTLKFNSKFVLRMMLEFFI